MSSNYITSQINSTGSFNDQVVAGQAVLQSVTILPSVVVNQLTSRTTAISTVGQKGSFKLFQASNIASAQTVTINNPYVKLSSVPLLSVQTPGTDVFTLKVRSITSGSFVLEFTASGTAVDQQPVFNYIIL
jgi:hypothetical protein